MPPKFFVFVVKKSEQEEGFKVYDPEEGIKLDINAEILEICIKFMHYKTVQREVSTERKIFHIEPE